MTQTKTIKIFLASSEELRMERLTITEMEMVLNNVLRKRGIQIEVEKWEHLDSSMGIKHKQEEYNDVLCECDICLALFWTKFGDYTKEEFEVAYNEMIAGRNPQKLYVLFKDAEKLTSELENFKSSFAVKYRHSYNRFNNADMLKLHFVKMIEDFVNPDTPFLTIENGYTTIDDTIEL